MSDSFGQISSPARALATRGFGGGGQTVQILSLPNDIANQARTLRLEGQITAFNNNNNTARILTNSGEITAQVRGNPAPQVGQNIEIEIPPARQQSSTTGRADTQQSTPDQTRQAIIRGAPSTPSPPESARIQATYTSPPQGTPQISSPAPRQTIPNSITSPVPEGAAPPPQNTATTPTRNTAIPASVQESLLQTTSLNNTQNTARVLLNEAIFRLLPTPPAQAQNIATQFIQTLPAPILNNVTQTAFTTNLIAQNAQNTLVQPLLNIATPAPLTNTPIIQNPLNIPLQITTQPIQNIVISPPAPGGAQVISSSPIQTNLAAIIPTNQTLPVQSVEAFLRQNTLPTSQTPTNQITGQTSQPTLANVSGTLTPSPITTTTQPTASTPLLGQIDVKITQILPPATALTPVAQNTILPPQTNALATPTLTQLQASQTVVPSQIQTIPNLISANNAVTATAQVTGFTPQGLPLVTVQWPGARIPQSFILQSPAQNLQLGTQLQIMPTPNTNVSASQVSPALVRNTMANPLLMGFQWPAMDEVFTNMLQNAPQLAASLTRTLPNAGNPQQLAPAAMAVIAAIRTGDMGSWLGERKVDLLQRLGKADLINSLRQTATTAAPTAETTATSDWRAVPLPMFWEGEIHKITLYTRRENMDQQNQDKPEGGKTRFIFDLSLSRLGDIQLDGYLQDKRLDLVVRTQNAFSLPMQQTMRQAYTGALDQANLSGELNFQGSTKNWVHVLEQKEELGVNV